MIKNNYQKSHYYMLLIKSPAIIRTPIIWAPPPIQTNDQMFFNRYMQLFRDLSVLIFQIKAL